MMSCCVHNDASQNLIIPMTKLQPAADNISTWPGEPFLLIPLNPIPKMENVVLLICGPFLWG